MSALYHREQQTQLTNDLTLLQRREMPSFYPSTRHRTLVTKQLSSNEDDDDHNSIYKEAFIIEIFQHWKAKALEHQHAINNTEDIPSTGLLQIPSITISSFEKSNSETTSGETALGNNTDEPVNVSELTETTITVQKRTKPAPILRTREKPPLKKSVTIANDSSYPNLLTPYTKSKHGTLSNTTSVAKKGPKPTLVFIEPKKTQPSFPLRSYNTFSFDESTQANRRNILEKQDITEDEQYSPTATTTHSPNACISPIRSFFPSTNNSFYDDDASSDEGYHESLLIRDRKNMVKSRQTPDKPTAYVPSDLALPTAIYITDPNGYSRKFDWNNGSLGEPLRIDWNPEKNFDSTNRNPVSFTNSSNASPLCTTTDSSQTELSVSDKYRLHSIGEEEEVMDKRFRIRSTVSKSKNHAEACISTQTAKSVVSKNDSNRGQHESDRNALERRWSDGLISDEDEHAQSLQRSIVKAPSAASIAKSPVAQPTKVSKTKYILMKLHLTSSSQKYEDSNAQPKITNPPPSKRTVRRALDKKRYQTQ